MHWPIPALARLVCSFALVLSAAAPTIAVVPIVWLGGAGDWTAGVNWVGGIAPVNVGTSIFSASIGSGNAVVNTDVTIDSLTFTGGAISGGFTLTLAGPTASTWTAGDFAGGGITKVGTGASLTLSGADNKRLYHGSTGSGGRTLENAGTLTWAAGAGNIQFGDGASIINRAGGSFLIQNDSAIGYAGFGNGGSVTNEGTVRKTIATGTNNISQSFINTGVVDTQSGTIDFKSGLTNSGELRAASGATNIFSGGQTFNSGTTFSGTGVNRITGGSTVFNGSITAANLEFAGGAASGTATFNGSVTWTSGDLVGPNTFSIGSGTLTLSGADNKRLYHGSTGSGGRTLENLAAVVWTGTGGILLGDGAQIVNRAGGTFTAQNDATIGYTGFGSGGSVTNEGTFTKTVSTGTTTLSSLSFVNTGLVNTQSGVLAFTSALTNSGELRAASGSSNTFTGTQAFNTGTSFTGGGANKISTGTTTFNGTVSSQNLEFAGGSAGGTAAINGDVKWTGGDWIGGNTFTFSSGTLAIAGGDNKRLYHGSTGSGGRIVSITSNATWEGTGSILGGDGAGIQIQTGGSFEIRNDSTLGYVGFGNAPFLSNAGTLRKVLATGTTTFATVVFSNSGVTRIETGTLLLNGGSGGLNNAGTIEVLSGGSFISADGSGTSSGVFNAATGGVLRFTGGTQTLTAGAKFIGTGSSEIAGANVVVNGASSVGSATESGKLALSAGVLSGTNTLTVTALGSLEWTGGDMAGPGTTLVATGGTLTISGSATKRLYHGSTGSGGRTISNFGTINWQGGTIAGGDGAQIRNEVGGLFDVQADVTLGYVGFGNGLTLTNAGTFRKSAGPGSATLNQIFNSSGLVDVTSGTLVIAAGGAGTGTFATGLGGVTSFVADYSLTGAKIVGLGQTRVSGGRLVLSGTVDVGSSTQTGLLRLVSGGTIGGDGTLTINTGSTLDWQGGDMSGRNATIVAADGQLLLSGAGTKRLFEGTTGSGGRALTNNGTVTWTGLGSLLLGDGSAINNNNVFDLQADTGLDYAGFGNGYVLTNSGVLKKSAGTGTFTIAGGALNNTGTVDVQSGTLRIAAGGTATGGQFNVGTNTRLLFTSDYTLLGARITGNGTASLSSSTLFANGATASELAGSFELVAGTSFAGTGVLEVSGNLSWLGGDMWSSGTTRVLNSGQVILSGSTNKRLYHGSTGSGGRLVENFGLFANEGSGALLFGDGASFINKAGATFELRSDAGVSYTGFGNAGTFTNSGSLLKTAGTATSEITSVNFTNTNLVWAKTGTLTFSSAVTNNAGTFQASTGASIQFTGNVGRTFDTNSAFAGGGATLIVAGTTTFNGAFTSTNLTFAGGSLVGPANLTGALTWTGGDWIGANTFAVTNGSLLTLDGAGTKRLTHGSTGSGGRVLSNSGVVTVQGSGNLQLGDGAQIVNNAGATFELRSDAGIVYAGFGNNGAFTNNGALIRTTSTGTATIAQPFTQNAGGTIAALAGTLAFTSSFTNNNGSVTLANNATLSLTSPLSLGTGSLSGAGTISSSSVSADGVVAPGAPVGTLAITGNLTLLSTSLLLLDLGGTTAGSGYDVISVGGGATVGGTLAVKFANGFQSSVTSANTFTVLTAAGTGGLSGAFTNIANGQRLFTTDGFGSFQVNYGTGSAFATNSLVLSNFVAVPEPSTGWLLAAGGALVSLVCRRKFFVDPPR